LARTDLIPDPSEAGVAALAVILCGAGLSYAVGLSPFVVCALETAVLTSVSPPAVRHAMAGMLTRWENALYAAFLVLAGALLRPISPWVLLAAPVLGVLRRPAGRDGDRVGGGIRSGARRLAGRSGAGHGAAECHGRGGARDAHTVDSTPETRRGYVMLPAR